jgi:hypothetical protein
VAECSITVCVPSELNIRSSDQFNQLNQYPKYISQLSARQLTADSNRGVDYFTPGH